MNIAELADQLSQAVAERTAIPRLTDRFHELDVPTGYRVQRELRAGAGPIAGWKLGLTSVAKQVQVNMPSPIYGFLPTTGALGADEPLTLSEHIHPRCEPEIVFVLARDLAGTHVTAEDVLAATSGVAVGIEVLDSRFVDYDFAMPDVVADNTSASRFLVGEPVSPAGIDLPSVGVRLEKNQHQVGSATGAASLGDPAAAVAWLVAQLATEGEKLTAGQIVLSGGLTAAAPVEAGDVVTATIEQLGSLALRCR